MLISESMKSLVESQQNQGDTHNLYVRIRLTYKQLVSLSDLQKKLENVTKKFTYINKEGQEVVAERRAQNERVRLRDLIRNVRRSGGIQIPFDQGDEVYLNIEEFGLSADQIKEIKFILSNEPTALFDIVGYVNRVRTEDPHRFAEFARLYQSIAQGFLRARQDNIVLADVMSILRTDVPIERESITIPAKGGLIGIFEIASSERVVQPTYAEKNNLVKGVTPMQTEVEADLGTQETSKETARFLRRLAGRYESIQNKVLAAIHPMSPKDLLSRLSSNRSERIRAAVATNPSTPQDVLDILKNDESELVRNAVANRGTPNAYMDPEIRQSEIDAITARAAPKPEGGDQSAAAPSSPAAGAPRVRRAAELTGLAAEEAALESKRNELVKKFESLKAMEAQVESAEASLEDPNLDPDMKALKEKVAKKARKTLEAQFKKLDEEYDALAVEETALEEKKEEEAKEQRRAKRARMSWTDPNDEN